MFAVYASIDRRPITNYEEVRQRTSARRFPPSRPIWWDEHEPVIVWSDRRLEMLADRVIGIGNVRLDNAEDLASRFAATAGYATEWDVILSAYELSGSRALRTLSGEFAFVIWNRAERELFAVRDPLGLMTLYYSITGDGILIADRLSSFEASGDYDKEFIVDFIATGGCCATRTIWSGVLPVPPGAMLRWKDGVLRCERYWSADDIEPALDSSDMADAALEFRGLLESAVLKRLEAGRRTWAQLSGGLDSSSVVAIAATLGKKGLTNSSLGGTITQTDSLGTADDPSFAEAVVRRFGIRNEQIVDDWPWRRDGEPPPLTDQPSRDYAFYARDRYMTRIIKDAGGTSLLSGIGPDVYFPSVFSHIPDLIWKHRMDQGIAELRRWTVSRNESLWRTVPVHVVMPLAAPSLRNWWQNRRLQAQLAYKEIREPVRFSRASRGRQKRGPPPRLVLWRFCC